MTEREGPLVDDGVWLVGFDAKDASVAVTLRQEGPRSPTVFPPTAHTCQVMKRPTMQRRDAMFVKPLAARVLCIDLCITTFASEFFVVSPQADPMRRVLGWALVTLVF